MPDIIQMLVDGKIAVCAGRAAIDFLEILYRYGFYYLNPGERIPLYKVDNMIDRFGNTLCFNRSKFNEHDERHIGYDSIVGMTNLGYDVITLDDFMYNLYHAQGRNFDQEAFDKLIT